MTHHNTINTPTTQHMNATRLLRTGLAATTTMLVAAALATMFTVTSCRSRQTTIDTTDPTLVAHADHVTRVNLNRLTAPAVRGRMNLTLRQGKNKLSVGGRIRMKRNEVVQLSLMPHGLVEVGILELTPDYFLLLDKWGKQYVKAEWSDIKALERANIDFYAFQALFWEELFVPGKKDKALKEDFDVQEMGESMRLQPTRKALKQRDAELAFVANTINGLIGQTVVTSPENEALRFEWNYADWFSLGQKDFPSTMTVNVRTERIDVGATFKLSSMQPDENMKDIRTIVNTDRYRKVEIESILTRIMAM